MARVPMAAAVMAAFLCLPAATAYAQSQVCGKYRSLTSSLERQFGERAIASGVSNNGRLYVEFWASAQGGTWTVVTVMQNRMTCITAAGEQFQFIAPASPPAERTSEGD